MKNTPRRRQADHRRADPIALRDEVLVCCRNIETLAELLMASGVSADRQPVAARHVAHAGRMVAHEIETLLRLLDQAGNDDVEK